MTTGTKSMPMAGITAQIDPADDHPDVHYPDADTVDPRILIWARQTGRYLPGKYQSVLVELAFFAKRGGDGIVWPSQQTIADNLGKSRSEVNGVLQELEVLGVVRSSIRHEIEGHHKQYQLMGQFNNWEPMLQEVKERRPVFLILSDRLAAQDAEIEDLKRQLAEALGAVQASEVSPERTPAGVVASGVPMETPSGPNVRQHDIRLEGGLSAPGGEPGPNVLPADIRSGSPGPAPGGESGPNVLSDDIRSGGQGAADMEEWVDREWDWIKQSKEHPKGWYSGKSRFLAWLKDHPEEFAQQKEAVEGRKQVGTAARPMTPHERRIAQDKRIPLRDKEHRAETAANMGHTPDHPVFPSMNGQPAPEREKAQEIWRTVLGELQRQLPRSAFQTWLKHTDGLHVDETRFYVEAPTAFAVTWLERRMYNAIQKAVELVTEKPLEVHFAVAQSQGHDA